MKKKKNSLIFNIILKINILYFSKFKKAEKTAEEDIMQKLLLIITIIAALAVALWPHPAKACSLTVDGTEMIVNGDFQTGLTGWDWWGEVSVTPGQVIFGPSSGAIWQVVNLPAVFNAGRFSATYKVAGGFLEIFAVEDDGTYLQLMGEFEGPHPEWEDWTQDITPLITGDKFIILGFAGQEASLKREGPGNTVPEPCTMALVGGGGLLGLSFRRR